MTSSEEPPGLCIQYLRGGRPVFIRGFNYYTGKVIYENGEAKTVGSISVKAPTSAAFTTDITTIPGTVALGTAVGTAPSHDSSDYNFSCTHVPC